MILRPLIFILSVAPLFTALPSFAQNADVTRGFPIDGESHHGKDKPGKEGVKKGSRKGAAAKITGACVIVPSPMNPISGPCVNLVLVLKDPEGKDVLKDRTNSQGQFEFSTEAGKAYTVASGSKFYDVVSPKGQIRSGSSIELKLQQK